jgi:hypothetical protein
MIQLIEGHWFNPYEVVSVKSIGKDKCILWTTGQAATEGHVLDYSAEDVVDTIESCYSDEETEEDNEPEEE